MAHRVSIFAGLVVRAETPTAAAASAAGLVDAFNANPSGFVLVNQHAQTAAVVANVAAVAVQASPVAFINVATNTFAGATVFLKIVADVKNGREIKTGDVISLVSNVAAVAITLTVMATGVGGITLAAVAVAASVGSFFSSRVVQDSYNNMIDTLWRRYYENQPSANYSENMVVSPQLTYASQQEYINNHGGARLVCKWDPVTEESWCDAISVRISPGDGGGWNDWNYWNYWNDYGGWGGGGGWDPWIPGGEVIVWPLQPDDEYQNDEYL